MTALAHLRVHCIVETPITFCTSSTVSWEELFGETSGELHRRFEHCIHQVSPAAFSVICPHEGKALPPYILRPPQDAASRYGAGAEFSIELILFPQALEYAGLIFDAIDRVGQTGLGRSRGKFIRIRIEAVRSQVLPDTVWESDTPWIDAEDLPIQVSELLQTQPPVGADIAIEFLTPTWVETSDRDKNPDTGRVFERLIRSLLDRGGLLGLIDGPAAIPGSEQRQSIEAAAKLVQVKDSQLSMASWHYQSLYKRRVDTHRGWLGWLRLEGDFRYLAPILWLGQWIHTGKHSSFGLGQYRLRSY